jgi:hypothetical protein
MANRKPSMKSIPTQRTIDYHEWQIESLQDAEERAGYVEIVLEEGSDDPLLLPKVLSNVVEAYRVKHELSDSACQCFDRFLKLLAKSSGAEIYTFIELLDLLDLQVKIVVKSNSSHFSTNL